MNKIVWIFLIVIFSINLYCNEKNVFDYNKTFFSFRLNQNTSEFGCPDIVKFSDASEDYNAKSIKMRNVGIGGIVMLSLGLTFESASSVLFILGYVDYILAGMNFQAISMRSMVFFYVGLIGTAVFELVFLGGLAMTIAGFALSAYYKKKANKITINTFNDFDRENVRFGFLVRI
jgi:hypothetical protein